MLRKDIFDSNKELIISVLLIFLFFGGPVWVWYAMSIGILPEFVGRKFWVFIWIFIPIFGMRLSGVSIKRPKAITTFLLSLSIFSIHLYGLLLLLWYYIVPDLGEIIKDCFVSIFG